MEQDNKKLNNLENKIWFRFAKVVYIISIVFWAGVIVMLSSFEGWETLLDGPMILFIGLLIIWIFFFFVKKAFLYIVVGK